MHCPQATTPSRCSITLRRTADEFARADKSGPSHQNPSLRAIGYRFRQWQLSGIRNAMQNVSTARGPHSLSTPFNFASCSGVKDSCESRLSLCADTKDSVKYHTRWTDPFWLPCVRRERADLVKMTTTRTRVRKPKPPARARGAGVFFWFGYDFS